MEPWDEYHCSVEGKDVSVRASGGSQRPLRANAVKVAKSNVNL